MKQVQLSLGEERTVLSALNLFLDAGHPGEAGNIGREAVLELITRISSTPNEQIRYRSYAKRTGFRSWSRMGK